MTDVNYQISKTLVEKYGPATLFVIEDLTGVSFNERYLRGGKQSTRLRSWCFYQLEEFLDYKASLNNSFVLRVPAGYTSQRCPRCGRIRKENRNHDKHEYVCDACGYRNNDDRVGAMNLYWLGLRYAAGEKNPVIEPDNTSAGQASRKTGGKVIRPAMHP